MGTITWEGFIRGLKHISSVSDRISDGWRFHGNLDVRNGAYFAKKVTICHGARSKNSSNLTERRPDSEEVSLFDDGIDEEDPSCLAIDPLLASAPVIGEFHVVYSEAYSVPTLFYRMWRPDGSPVPIEDVWREFASKQALDDDDEWDRLRTVTQQEHPFLGEPWYLLHPCRTCEFMSAVSRGDDDVATHHLLCADELYMLRWLSTVAPLVGCPVSHCYASTASDDLPTPATPARSPPPTKEATGPAK